MNEIHTKLDHPPLALLNYIFSRYSYLRAMLTRESDPLTWEEELGAMYDEEYFLRESTLLELLIMAYQPCIEKYSILTLGDIPCSLTLIRSLQQLSTKS